MTVITINFHNMHGDSLQLSALPLMISLLALQRMNPFVHVTDALETTKNKLSQSSDKSQFITNDSAYLVN